MFAGCQACVIECDCSTLFIIAVGVECGLLKRPNKFYINDFENIGAKAVLNYIVPFP